MEQSIFLCNGLMAEVFWFGFVWFHFFYHLIASSLLLWEIEMHVKNLKSQNLQCYLYKQTIKHEKIKLCLFL